MEVNDPGELQLLRYFNLPPQWTMRAGSGVDRFLSEETGSDRKGGEMRMSFLEPFEVLRLSNRQTLPDFKE